MCNPIFFCFQLTFHATCFCAYLVGKEKFEHNATPFFERHVLLFCLLLALKNCFSECMCACVTVVITDERRKPAFLSAWYSWTWVLQTSFFLTNICLMISYLEPHPPYIFRIFFSFFFLAVLWVEQFYRPTSTQSHVYTAALDVHERSTKSQTIFLTTIWLRKPDFLHM